MRDPDVQLISVCTPHALHAVQAIAAAQAGKHVLVEKPVALTLEELGALRAAVRAAGVVAMCGFVLRWNPLLRNVRGQVESGALGRLSLARADYWNRSRRGFDAGGWWSTTGGAGCIM